MQDVLIVIGAAIFANVLLLGAIGWFLLRAHRPPKPRRRRRPSPPRPPAVEAVPKPRRSRRERLRDVVDGSVGMYLFRRALGRSTALRSKEPPVPLTYLDEAVVASRIGAAPIASLGPIDAAGPVEPLGPVVSRPTRLVVAGSAMAETPIVAAVTPTPKPRGRDPGDEPESPGPRHVRPGRRVRRRPAVRRGAAAADPPAQGRCPRRDVHAGQLGRHRHHAPRHRRPRSRSSSRLAVAVRIGHSEPVPRRDPVAFTDPAADATTRPTSRAVVPPRPVAPRHRPPTPTPTPKPTADTEATPTPTPDATPTPGRLLPLHECQRTRRRISTAVIGCVVSSGYSWNFGDG